eukprot:scaffold30552_cov70-Phaeocystis_antarctica.AAC.1
MMRAAFGGGDAEPEAANALGRCTEAWSGGEVSRRSGNVRGSWGFAPLDCVCCGSAVTCGRGVRLAPQQRPTVPARAARNRQMSEPSAMTDVCETARGERSSLRLTFSTGNNPGTCCYPDHCVGSIEKKGGVLFR